MLVVSFQYFEHILISKETVIKALLSWNEDKALLELRINLQTNQTCTQTLLNLKTSND